MRRPMAALAANNVQDVNQLKAELQAQRQRQAELEDKVNQLEARQKLRERMLNEKIGITPMPRKSFFPLPCFDNCNEFFNRFQSKNFDHIEIRLITPPPCTGEHSEDEGVDAKFALS